VAHWLWENDMLKEQVLRQAEQLNLINLALELMRQQQLDPKLAEEVIQCITDRGRGKASDLRRLFFDAAPLLAAPNPSDRRLFFDAAPLSAAPNPSAWVYFVYEARQPRAVWEETLQLR
jgi:hypothetical protein